MSLRNKAILTGNLGADPEYAFTPQGTLYGKLSIAVNEWNAQTETEETQWFRCVAWGSVAERMQKLSIPKGSRITVEGKIKQTQYQDKTTGATQYGLEIVVFEFVPPIVANGGNVGGGVSNERSAAPTRASGQPIAAARGGAGQESVAPPRRGSAAPRGASVRAGAATTRTPNNTFSEYEEDEPEQIFS